MPEYYGTLAGALAYHAARGNTAWASAESDALREAALLRGSLYIDRAYRASFPGERALRRLQTLEWPRTDATDIEDNPLSADEVPIEIQHASYEAALRELVSPGSMSADTSAQGQVLRRRVKAGTVESETEYAGVYGGVDHPIIDGILSSLIRIGGLFLGRASRS